MTNALQDKDMNLYPICVVPPERHYDSCKELVDDIRWFEQSRAHFYQDYPQLKPKAGLFEKVRVDDKKGYILLPTSLDYGVLYRGQGSYHGRCLPALYRLPILDDSLGIDWKIPTEHANLSEKDTKHAMLKDFDSPFDINVDLY